jgi:pimeloyl-ACP methyl ester carboxylesterase
MSPPRPDRLPHVNKLSETDIRLPDGRTLHVYDAGPDDGFPVLWLHGSPNLGPPPRPLFDAAGRLGLRWLGYDRPGYGGSTPQRGRSIAGAAADVAAIADALGVPRLAVVGHSGGAPHALACAALLPGRVAAVVAISGLGPYGADGLDWFGDMAPAGVGSLTAARRGPAAREAFEADPPEEPDIGFTPADWAALSSDWAWMLEVVQGAQQAGGPGAIDDDLAAVGPWGFDPADAAAPVLVVHGDADRMVPPQHGRWLAGHIPGAELWLRPGDGHITVLHSGEAALDWVARHRP